ncbi:hypothetical protein EVS84_05270 [Pseudomonas koreensis]|uniref:Uncharacterized protein n=1 Tax=Pseudomonas koreensis TaxID=198620 RepID=A0A4Q4LAP3_9PSED|nr:hypothetical protein EVS84_05270 [Pseudomonas koreensis]
MIQNLKNYRQPLWERACSRMRLNIQHLCELIHRLREQARSHIWIAVNQINRFTRSCNHGQSGHWWRPNTPGLRHP